MTRKIIYVIISLLFIWLIITIVKDELNMKELKQENLELIEELKRQKKTYKFELLKPIIFYKGMNENKDTLIFNAVIVVDNMLIEENPTELSLQKSGLMEVRKKDGIHEIRVKDSNYPKLRENLLEFYFLDSLTGKASIFDCEWPENN